MRLRLRGHIARRGTKYNRVMRPTFNWQLRSRGLNLGVRTCVMGVVNVTPDSFSDGGRYLDARAALFWAFVGIPILWGVYITLKNAAAIFS